MFAAELVDQVIDVAGSTEQRNRSLPARVMASFSIGMALHSEGSYEDVFAQLTDGLAWSSAGRRRGRRQGNPMSQIDSFGMSGSSWLKVAAGMSSGTAAMSDTANVNCANGGWCSQLSTGRAPMAGTVVAVS